MCSERRPGRFAGEFGDDLVGSAIEHLNELGTNQLLGRDMEPVGVALDGVVEPGSRSLSSRSSVVAEVGVSSRARIWCKVSIGVRGAGCDGLGPNEGVRVAVADDLQVEVVGCPSSGEHRVQLLAGLLSGGEPAHGVGGDALGGVDGGGVAESGRGLNVVGGEPDGEVAAEKRAGEALQTMTDDGRLSLREVVDWCGSGVTVREATRLRLVADRPPVGGTR